MPVQINSYLAIISGSSWAGKEVYNTPSFITFSFPKTQPSWHSRYDPALFEQIQSSDQVLIRAVIGQWEKVAGVNFLEVSGAQGDIVFSKYDFSQIDGYEQSAGFAYYPGSYNLTGKGLGDRTLPVGGDVFLDSRLDAFGLMQVAQHEIGHAIGLKHPFETMPGHPETLDDRSDRRSNTVMSYTPDSSFSLGTYDREAARALYGSARSEGSGADSFTWNAKTRTLSQVGDAGAELIRGINLTDIITGGGGADRIYGLAGADRLWGDTGSDRLWGGEGADVFNFTGKSGADRIFDYGNGNDTIRIYGVKGLDAVDDLKFLQAKTSMIVSWDGGRLTVDYNYDYLGEDLNIVIA